MMQAERPTERAETFCYHRNWTSRFLNRSQRSAYPKLPHAVSQTVPGSESLQAAASCLSRCDKSFSWGFRWARGPAPVAEATLPVEFSGLPSLEHLYLELHTHTSQVYATYSKEGPPDWQLSSSAARRTFACEGVCLSRAKKGQSLLPVLILHE